METCSKPAMIKQFIEKRVKQLDQQYEQTENVMEKLRLATMKASFANILSLYLGDQSQTAVSLVKQAYAYFNSQCYDQAILRARLARKLAEKQMPEKNQQMELLIVNCMIKQKKFQDAHDMLSGIEPKHHKIEYSKIKIQIQQHLNDQEGSILTLSSLELLIQQKFTKLSVQYGFFIILKGENYGKFQKYQDAIKQLNHGMDILIQNKCKQKKKIAKVYLKLAQFHRKLNNHQRQYTSLICAHSMVRQVPNSQKQTVDVIHMLVKNLLNKEQYEKAIVQLNKAKSLQKSIYGEYSSNVGRSLKKIAQILHMLNRKVEAKKYEQESSRILGTSSSSSNTNQAPTINQKIGRNLAPIDLNTLK